MSKHEEKYCPRCETKFECKLGSILMCQCATVKLDQDERDFINEIYDDCLCANCMKALRSEYRNHLFQTKLKAILGVFYRKPKIIIKTDSIHKIKKK